MRSFVTATTVLALLAKEVIATPPACLLACVAQVSKESSQCSELNQIACVCSNEADSIKSCVDSICPNNNGDTAYDAFEGSCKDVGAEVASHSNTSSSSVISSSATLSSSSLSSTLSSSFSSASSSTAATSTSLFSSTSSSLTATASSDESTSRTSTSSTVTTSTTTAASSSSSTFTVSTVSGNGLALNAPVGALVGVAAFGLLF